MPPLPKTLVVPWFLTASDWQSVRDAAVDGIYLGANFAEWLAKFTLIESSLIARGHEVRRVEVDAKGFFPFCKEHALPLDAEARHRYVLDKIGVNHEGIDRAFLTDSDLRRRRAIGIYREDQWDRLRAIDPDVFDESYAVWQAWIPEAIAEWVKEGIDVIPIDVDLDEVQEWWRCKNGDRPLDFAALHEFVSDRLKLINPKAASRA